MKRRLFLSIPLIATIFSFFACVKKDDPWRVIESVQEHLFPQTSKYPGAKSFQATRYLKMVSQDESFDKDDLDFLLRGADALQEKGYKAVLESKEKEALLQTFKKTRFGENWLALMVNYGIEALLSDPLYGGNKDVLGWSSFKHHPGLPRPTKTFGAKHG